MLPLQDGVDLRQPHDQLLLLLLSPEQRRHLLLQVADDVGVHLGGGKQREALSEKKRNMNLLPGA